MNQCLLSHEASGAAIYDRKPPRHSDRMWIELSQDRFTQAELHYVQLSDITATAHEIAAVVNRHYSVASMRLGLVIFLGSVIAGIATFVSASPVFSILSAALLAIACFVCAGAVETYQRAGR